LESLTWAIWGKSRANSDDDLISQGQSSMWVDFIFKVANKIYRIVRKRSSKGRGSSELYLHQIMNDEPENITEETIKKTQDKIEKIIRMPYRIFINSAYLRQGHADEFTSRTPTERKDILAQILDLKYYEQIQEKAKEKYRESVGKIETMQIQINDMKSEISSKDVLKKEFEQANKEKDTLKNKLVSLQKKFKELQASRDKYQKISEQIESLRDRFVDVKSDIENLVRENEILAQKNNELGKLLTRKGEIEKRVQELKLLDKLNYQMSNSLHELSELRQKLSVAEKEIMSKKNIIELEKSSLSSEHNKEKSMYQDQIKNISDLKICPTCRQKVTPSHVGKLKKELGEKLDNLEKKYKINLKKIALKKIDESTLITLQYKIKSFTYDPKKHAEVQEKIENLTEFEDEKEALISAKQDKKNNLENIAKNKAKLSEKKAHFLKIKKADLPEEERKFFILKPNS
jgi:exonuclease SbcC